MTNKNLYLFLDESGNYDFSPSGTKYLVFACLTTTGPHCGVRELYDLKHEFVQKSLSLEYFHATEDKQLVRDAVFKVIQKCENFVVDSVIVEKCKANPVIRPIEKLYPQIYKYLIQYVCNRYSSSGFDKMIIFTDRIPVKKNQKSVEKALKTSIKACIPSSMQKYYILHHDSKSHFYLQIVDYCCWAIYRKWNNEDTRSYNLIRDKIVSEFDIFQRGVTRYY